MSENPFNRVRYVTLPRTQTYPDRLAAMGIVAGMSPPPVAQCRVLEIGCGDGANLIPVACHFTQSRFLGVDLADQPIAEGRAAIAALGLDNIGLEAADLRTIGPEHGEFDYIIAHGVYSWVSPELRDHLLRVCRERLSPQGIAFVSYNALPGRYLRQMLGDMMRFHLSAVGEPLENLEQARWMLQFVHNSPWLREPWKQAFCAEAESLIEHADDKLVHDDLSEYCASFYFHEFMTHAARRGLQYVGEADPQEMFELTGYLNQAPQGLLERQQYLDFLRLRRFRQTLLCRDDCTLTRPPLHKVLHQLRFAAPAREVGEGRIEGLHGVVLTATHGATAAIAAVLRECWPFPASFDQMLPAAPNEAALREILTAFLVSGFADPGVYDYPCQRSITERPVATRLARYQAANSAVIANALGQLFRLDAMAARLVPLLDGTRTHAELLDALAAFPDAPHREELERGLTASLLWLANSALLEG